jgi:hypothetical protein
MEPVFADRWPIDGLVPRGNPCGWSHDCRTAFRQSRAMGIMEVWRLGERRKGARVKVLLKNARASGGDLMENL